MSDAIERLRRNVSLADTAAGYGVALEADGGEFTACCPFHSEDTASFTIFTGDDHVQRFHCFGCGEKGDVIDFVKRLKGVSTREAISILGGEKDDRPNVAPMVIKARRNPYDGIEPIDPEIEIEPGQWVELYNPKRAGDKWEWGKFKAEMVFPYRRADGTLFGYVLRRSLPDGGKETPMVMWVRLRNGKKCWSRFPFPKPRPLYGLDQMRDGQVILVEGEKSRDALAAASGRNVLTWPGGTQGIKYCDWSPLAGRSVVIWPDADKPGMKAAINIASILTELKATPRILDVLGEVAA